MIRLTRRGALILAAGLPLAGRALAPLPARAQTGPLRVEITEGVMEPLALAIPPFLDLGGAAEHVAALRALVTADLTGTGLFAALPEARLAAAPAGPDAAPAWQEWRAADANALIVGAARMEGGRLRLRFRLYDIYAAQPLGDGIEFDALPEAWRRLGHKLADQVYARLTGEAPYFDSRIAFVAESGPRTRRVKRIAMMDYDGANVRFLTDGGDLVLSPRFSPDGTRIAFVTFAGGAPRIAVIGLGGDEPPAILPAPPGSMAFAPRFSPDGRWLFYSQEKAGDTDIWQMDAAGAGLSRPVVAGHGIDTAPGLSPDGRRLVFESDRSGTPQLYVAPLDGSAEPERISFGEGRYGTPAWSPKGDVIAFTRRRGELYHIGTMAPDGSDERVLTESPHDEGPSWAPNGRVVVFTRQEPGGNGKARLHAVDIVGRNMRPVELMEAASDPGWGPLRP